MAPTKLTAAWLLGRRFVTDFRVVALGPGAMAQLTMYGDLYEIGVDELLTIIERGFVTEAPKEHMP